MENQLKDLQIEAGTAISAATSAEALKKVEVEYLGRKGKLTGILRGLKDLNPKERSRFGKLANDIKEELLGDIVAKEEDLTGARYDKLAETEWVDPTAPGTPASQGRLHPITQFMREAERVFTSLGFTVATGPQTEDNFHNFEALNIPADHPARDAQDTLFLKDFPELLLRSHTSTVQIRFGETHKPPFRIVAMGKVFRKDDFDASHSPIFHQLEGMLIGEDITLASMKAVMEETVHKLINPRAKFRFRSGYFPFVEPGLELDMSCVVCDGAGCSACKQVGWIELAGCGLVHPNVLTSLKIDPKKYQGFAFGFGIDRMVMMRHKIRDIRLLYENDLRFLKQF